MEPIVSAVSQFGLPGVVIAALLVWLKRLQDRIDTEHEARLADAKAYSANLQAAADARLADAKAYSGQALELQDAVHAAVNKLSELVEIWSPSGKRASIHDKE